MQEITKLVLLSNLLYNSRSSNSDYRSTSTIENECPLCRKKEAILIDYEWPIISRRGCIIQESRFSDYGNCFLISDDGENPIGFWSFTRNPEKLFRATFTPNELKNLVCQTCVNIEFLLPSEN